MSLLSWFRKRRVVSTPSIRQALFADMPLEVWPIRDRSDEPWASFVAARLALKAGDTSGATTALQAVLDRPGLESRQYLQAWRFLRDMGVSPPASTAKIVLGVVVEVGLDSGLDLIAAYADHHARYFNFSGSAVVWERPDASCDPLIDSVLSAGQTAVNQIAPWTGQRPPAPPRGRVRLNMLTPSGLHFGEGASASIRADVLGGPVLAAATDLMAELIAKSKR